MTDPYKFYIFAREPSSACIIDKLDFRIQFKRLFYRKYRGMFKDQIIVGEKVIDCVLYSRLK